MSQPKTTITPTKACTPRAIRTVTVRALAVVLSFAAIATAQESAAPGPIAHPQTSPKDAGIVRLTLQQDLSSRLPNGSAFSAVDGAGKVYTGYVATKKAKWFHGLWNRGTIRLVFDQPMQVVSVGGKAVGKNGDAPARTGARVMQAAEIGVAYSVAKIIDDAWLDEPYGVGPTKAIPFDIAIGVATAVVLPGPQAKLKAGTLIEAQRVAREPLPSSVARSARIFHHSLSVVILSEDRARNRGPSRRTCCFYFAVKNQSHSRICTEQYGSDSHSRERGPPNCMLYAYNIQRKTISPSFVFNHLAQNCLQAIAK